THVDATVIAHGLDPPGALAFRPNGHMLISEKPGKMRILNTKGAVGAPIANVPAVLFNSDGGLLDLVTDTHFAKNRQVYFAYAEPRDQGQGLTLGRAMLSADEMALEDVLELLRIEPSPPI